MPLAAHSHQRPKAQKAPCSTPGCWAVVVFIDDYLNALAVGSSMRKVTDKFKVSREMLAYVVDSTAAPICVLVPVSTWAVFYAGLFTDAGYAESGQGMDPLYQCYSLYGLPHSSHAFSTFSGSGDCARTGDDEVCRAESGKRVLRH